jgi:hypothetical protein
MKTLSRFITKFTSLIVAVLSCFDRVIFKGHLALAAPRELEYFVDCVLKVRRSDFMKTMAPQYSERLVQHAQGWALKTGRTYVYRTGDFRKDQWAQKLIRDQGISDGRGITESCGRRVEGRRGILGDASVRSTPIGLRGRGAPRHDSVYY